jgi:hypothetical protein
MALAEDSAFINPDPLIAAISPLGISETQIIETQEILNGRGYIKLIRTMGQPHVNVFTVQPFGFDKYVRVAVPDFSQICTDVMRILVREESMNHKEIALRLNQPTFLVEHVLHLLESNSLVRYAESGSGVNVFWVSPELKRKLEQS